MNLSVHVCHVHPLVSDASAHSCATNASKCLRLPAGNFVKFTFIVQNMHVAVRIDIPTCVINLGGRIHGVRHQALLRILVRNFVRGGALMHNDG